MTVRGDFLASSGAFLASSDTAVAALAPRTKMRALRKNMLGELEVASYKTVELQRGCGGVTGEVLL